MNKHKSSKIKENSNTVRHLIMGQITTTQNLVAIKESGTPDNDCMDYMDYLDLVACRPKKKAVKLNHSLLICRDVSMYRFPLQR